ncbi:MAG: hypothetical protein MPW15_16755 [Candidatus Manganitrophus sp.]|nr:hypothetical protein [Candidatus Manganitrophus sp.]
MVNIKKVGATFGMLVSLAFLIHGCGGGGGGEAEEIIIRTLRPPRKLPAALQKRSLRP